MSLCLLELCTAKLTGYTHDTVSDPCCVIERFACIRVSPAPAAAAGNDDDYHVLSLLQLPQRNQSSSASSSCCGGADDDDDDYGC